MLGGPGRGGQQQEVTAERAGVWAQGLSKDRQGCKNLRKQLVPALPPMKSFSKEAPRSHRANLGSGASFGEHVGKAGLGKGSLSLGERELGQFASDHA